MLIIYRQLSANGVVCHPWCDLYFSLLENEKKLVHLSIENWNLNLLKRIFNIILEASGDS